ncbi:hypothetical protein SynRCC2555_01084 [Synechococcus sp. WH 8101]|uniref:hypothetical protein n=1 Tax=Synechococcus sp. WH 8101 TaxID=59932 RepID=UPI001023DFDE|nr:hypothetical protein [Synechococcus sp. WH 8101]QNI44870.1 hypothetical protein SynRCC2555_01084 [Synechococcus sp. WH 8101]
MTSRRLVVWISTGILGFQGATLAFDLLNCTALSWLVLRVNGLPRLERQQKHQPSAAENGLVLDPDAKPQTPAGTADAQQTVSLFCERPQNRIDDAVKQGLSILAGLALGSSVPGNGRERL